MNLTQRDYDSIIYITDVARRCCGTVHFDWHNFDGGPIQFKEQMFDPTVKRLEKIGREPNEEVIRNLLEETYICTQWLRFKKIYNFQPTFVDYLEETEGGKVSSKLLERLPFRSFYIFLGERKLTETHFSDGKSKVGWMKGMYVDVYVEKDAVCFSVLVTYVPDKENQDNFKEWLLIHSILRVQDGLSFEESTDYRQLSGEELKKALRGYSESDMDLARKFWLPIFRIALNACNYLCASNAEVKDIKIPKKDRPIVERNGKKKPMAIQVSNVGFRLGEQFERMYSGLDSESRQTGVKGVKKRPHVRRAHWHHYWTGPGRTILEVRWLEPVFVMGSEEEIDTVIHEVKGE